MSITSIRAARADEQQIGGKGANLARLARAGLPVPPGFLIPIEAYQDFLATNALEEVIALSTEKLQAKDVESLQNASAAIRSAFARGHMPGPVETEIRAAFAELGRPAVAVRSSATLEDSPALSFAGQQDTFLNVVDEPGLLVAVIECWSSLWTARAIGYRLRNGIGQKGLGLAVVVQEMVQSEISGVLFTANPVTGLLSETVIDAAFGLGEALVAGQVEPDHYVVNQLTGAVADESIGEKAISIRAHRAGGVKKIEESRRGTRALSDDQIREVVALGQNAQSVLGGPQDVEWAIADGDLYLLQSRPITSLFPVPAVSFDPLSVWFSFGAVQGLVGPMTPLGRDLIRNLFAKAGGIFGARMEPENVEILVVAGERLWIKISDLVRNPLGYRVLPSLVGFVEPSVGQILDELSQDPRLGAGKGKLKFATLARLARFALPVLVRLPATLIRPARARANFDARLANLLAAARIDDGGDRYERLTRAVSHLRRHVASLLADLLPQFLPLFGPAMASLNLLNKFAEGDRALVLEITRALPRNVTTEMDLALWRTAQRILRDGTSERDFVEGEAADLARRYLEGELPAEAQAALADFLEDYGMRGVGEIDFGQARWREDPTPVMRVLQSYLTIDPEKGPDLQFAKGRSSAEAAINELSEKVRKGGGGWIKANVVRWAARRVRVLMGVRESPKFLIVRVMGITRRALLSVGDQFAQAGEISRPQDLFFLQLPELDLMAAGVSRDWRAIVETRRLAYERELRRREVPRVLVSDGRAFYQGLGAETDSADRLGGSPVSPGVVEGTVRIVLDPNQAELAPGEILVCPGTDPAWTPLFMTAGGLITEVGGMMTHGSVVAREYGIPAVVGVHQATERLKDGQEIRLNGSTGEIFLLR